MAIWYTPHDKEKGAVKCVLHFNLWNYAKTSFLDIGLMIAQDYANVKTISIYIPAAVENCEIADLGCKFRDVKTCIGIFNEPVSPTTTNSHVDINFEDSSKGKRLTRAHILNVAEYKVTGVDAENEERGTLLEIGEDALNRAKNGLSSEDTIYFRVRVRFKPEESLCSFIKSAYFKVRARFKPKKSLCPFIESVGSIDNRLFSRHDVLKFIDFRLNEYRNLPESILRTIQDNKKFLSKETHFLVAIDVDSDFVGGHQSFHKCRMLEKPMWSSYVPSGETTQLPDHMVIYHWKTQDPEKPDFSAFLKFRVRRSNKLTISIYLSILAVIGVLCSYVASMIPPPFPAPRDSLVEVLENRCVIPTFENVFLARKHPFYPTFNATDKSR